MKQKELLQSILQLFTSFFEDAVTNNYMVALFIDDFHNIHSHHCPSSSSQTQVCHMTTLLVKKFPTMPAIKPHSYADQDSLPANLAVLESLLQRCTSSLSKTHVDIMPDWVQAKFFDPESQRSRLLVHDCKQREIQDIQAMRTMANCKLVDCIKLPLKSLENFHSALEYLLK